VRFVGSTRTGGRVPATIGAREWRGVGDSGEKTRGADGWGCGGFVGCR
jgi:hypothetical protein